MGTKKKKSNRNHNSVQKDKHVKTTQPITKKPTNWKKVFVVLASVLSIAIVGYILYSGTIKYNLVFCDDNIFVLNFNNFNKNVDNIKTSFEKTVGTTYYRPMLNVSFIYDALRADPSIPLEQTAPVYRATNVYLHLLASCLVFLLFVKLKYPLVPSLLFGMLVVVHPILTPAAAWISGRNDSMITIFIVTSFILFLFYIESKTVWRVIILPLHLLFFALSIFTKEIAFVYPLVCISYVWFFKKDRHIFRMKYIIATIGWFVVGFIWFFMRLAAIENIKNPDEIGLGPILINFPTLFAMMGKIFFPVKMIALSSYEWFSIATGAVVIVALTVYLIKSKKLDKNKSFFGILWFALFLLPTFLVRIIYVGDFFDYAEHRAYLPMIGILIFLIEILISLKVDFKKPIAIAVSVIILGTFTARSYVYAQNFENRTTFWTHMIDMYPLKPRGYLDLAKAYFANDDLVKAESLYRRGIQLNPNNKNLYIDVSVIYLKWNKLQKAEQYARKAVELDSNDYLANYNYGKALFMLEKYSEALRYFEKACMGNLAFPQWFVDLGVTYYQNKMFDEAVQSYQRAISMAESMGQSFPIALAYSDMGAAFAQMHKQQEAVSCWQKAVQLDPRMYDAYMNLIKYYIAAKSLQPASDYIVMLKRNGGSLSPEILNFLNANKLELGQ